MNNYKTTVSGLVMVAGFVLKIFGIELPEDVTSGIVAIGAFLMGFFAKDK